MLIRLDSVTHLDQQEVRRQMSRQEKLERIGAVVMNKSNGNPSFWAATPHTFAPLMVRDNYLFFSGLFQFQPVVLWRSIEQTLMSYWHFHLSAYASCLLCHVMGSRGSGLGVCFHMTFCQFLHCSSVSLFRDFFELLTSSVPGCSAQCQAAKFSAPAPNTCHPSYPAVLSGKASGCPHLVFLPPNSSNKP